jgi:hypothetical protein
MPTAPDTSDLRALARVILDREDLEQSAMRASVRPYELAPVRRRVVEGARVGLLIGVGLGLASVGSGTARTFRSPQWALYLVLFVVMATAIGAAVGACAGFVVHGVQRRRLDRELTELTKPPHGSLRRRREERGELRGR